MALANTHPRHGYYTSRAPFGAAGDFITAPDISQMFGELIGLWCASVWEQMGQPRRVLLVELGPGRGTLASDALRAIRQVSPAFRQALELHLVETSRRLRAEQAAALAGENPAWHDAFAHVPRAPLLLIANEFFDALPVRQFLPDGRERRVGLDGDALRFLDEASAPGVSEDSPERQALATAIAERVVAEGGASLLIDYGAERHDGGDTLQAVRRHRYAPVLESPGEADLSAPVDFGALAKAARQAGAAAHGPVGQGVFLRLLGIEARAALLAAKASAEQRAQISSALRRLTEPDAMGALFKVLAIADPRLKLLDGFAPC
ncbi:MAG: class I SAM-dependent methyltransferase [Alphaproteobacteria bacterium]|nr:class I SAM-dependent methyltransferase [Alphaproteobacteria bacterium]